MNSCNFFLENYSRIFESNLPNFCSSEQFVAHVRTFFAENSQKIVNLNKEETELLYKTLINLSYLGLSVSERLGEAIITISKDKRSNLTTFNLQIMFKGMLKILYKSGAIKSHAAEIVYATDHFEIELFSKKIVHIPDFRRKSIHVDANFEITKQKIEENIIGAWSSFDLPGGDKKINFMTTSEILTRVPKFSSDRSVWNSDFFTEMFKKTVIKNNAKGLACADDRVLKYADSIENEQFLSEKDNEDKLITYKETIQ